LPLAEILVRVDPALLRRQQPRRRIEIPTDMPMPFAGGSPARAGVGAEPAEPRARAFEAAKPAVDVPLMPAAEVARPAGIVTAPPVVPEEISAVPPGPPLSPTAPPATLPQPEPASIPINSALLALARGTSADKTASRSSGRPMSPLEPVAPPAQQSPGPVVARSADGTSLLVSLSAVWEKWPAAIRAEVSQSGGEEATLVLPMEIVQQGLKLGLLSYNWKTLRGWIQPAGPATNSANDTVAIVLPLSVIAPVFLSQRGGTTQRRKLALDSEIPDLFQAGSRPLPKSPVSAPVAEAEPIVPATPARPVPAPVASTPPPAMAKVAEGEPADRGIVPRFREHTPTQKIPFTPDEIVDRATALKGVAGAVVTLADGLPVASRLPAGCSAETIAAFMPQLYSRVGSSMSEFQIGQLTRLRFYADEVPWEIFCIGKVYLAVYGRAGENFPEEDLKTLANGMESVS
jgi:predicted regulator of Ras-like GTPase activity (Roadblock/LC7/MglB family)